MRSLVATPERRLLLLALAVRVIPAFFIYGTDDVQAWETWGWMLSGGVNPYTSKYPIAWPPLWLPATLFSHDLSDVLPVTFSFIAKLLPIFADVAIALLLAHTRSLRAGFLYAINPAPIYTSAIHGNFDPIPSLCVMVALLTGDDDSTGIRPGLALGLGGAFKTWPMLLLPALVAPAMPLRRRFNIVLSALAVYGIALILPWPLAGASSIATVIHYRGAVGWWGVTAFFPAVNATLLFYAAMTASALLILATRTSAPRGALLLLLTFFATTPGFGPQYLMWLVPVALAVDTKWTNVYATLAGATIAFELLARPFTGAIGDTVRTLPHLGYARAYGGATDQLFTTIDRAPIWIFVIVWCVACAVSIVRRAFIGRSSVAA